MRMASVSLYFVFQAEDGIRDKLVTGVQTCALPICGNPRGGSAAMHQFANWPRFHPEDFRVKTQYGRGLDWPISYADLRPYYDRIQKEVGLSGDHVAEVWRPAGDPYPMPPIRWFRQAELLAEGFRKIGMRTAPTPLAIHSLSYNGRPACIYDGWCEAGCPTGALVNPQVTYLPIAKKAGVEIRTGAYGTRGLVNAKGDRASGVEYYDKARERRAGASPRGVGAGV